MANYKKGHKYWTSKHEDLCKQWLSATTEIQYTRIHNDLRTTLNYMGELILNRYYAGLNASQQSELKQDAINFLFLRLKDFNPEKGTAYNFCGMILKRYYYDKLILKKERLFTMDGKIDFLDDLPENAIPVQYEQTEIDYDRVLDFFKKLHFKLNKEYKKIMKSYPTREPVILKRYVIFTELCIQYVEKYKDFSPANIADYIYCNSPYNDKQGIVHFFKKMLNLNLGKNSISFESTDRNKTDDRFSYINDDNTPNSDKWSVRDKMRRLKIKYDDITDYSYF